MQVTDKRRDCAHAHTHTHPNNCRVLKINELLVSVSHGSGFQTHTSTRLHADNVCVGVDVKGAVGGKNHTHSRITPLSVPQVQEKIKRESMTS